MPGRNTQSQTGTVYVPRPGWERRLNKSLPVFREDELPLESQKLVRENAKTLAASLNEEQPTHQEVTQKKASARSTQKKHKAVARSTRQQQPVHESEATEAKSTLPVSCVEEVDSQKYNQLYSEEFSKIPEFPIKTVPELPRDGDSVGSLMNDIEQNSEYDMDTEDEEWIEKNHELNLSASRFEYVFGKLNRRDTDVKADAIRSLTDEFREDVEHVFPYWQEKHLRNVVSSTCHSNKGRNKRVNSKFFYSQSPDQIFTGVIAKKAPHGSSKETKAYEKSLKESFLKAAPILMKILLEFKEKAKKEKEEGLKFRNQLVNRIKNFKTKYSEYQAEHAITVESHASLTTYATTTGKAAEFGTVEYLQERKIDNFLSRDISNGNDPASSTSSVVGGRTQAFNAGIAFKFSIDGHTSDSRDDDHTVPSEPTSSAKSGNQHQHQVKEQQGPIILRDSQSTKSIKNRSVDKNKENSESINSPSPT